MSDYNTDWVNHIDWTNEQAYQDLAKMFSALAESLNGADVSTRSNRVVDGYIKRGLVEKFRNIAESLGSEDGILKYLYVRPPRNYSHHEGHRKEQ